MEKDSSHVVIIIIGVVLVIILTQIIPWQIVLLIIFLAVFAVAFFAHLSQEVAKAQQASKSIPQYHSPTQPVPPVEPIAYDEGYQEQAPSTSPARSSFGMSSSDERPKQAHPLDYDRYDQPQAHYPQHMPPMEP